MTLIERISSVITSIAEDITNNTIMLPRKIGATQRWYQSGLRHGAEYPYPCILSAAPATSGSQYFIPFTALEDATIIGLETFCTSFQANATISLGIYASDSNNDVADPLFTSAPISCGTTGVKNAPCNVQIKKGKVYWLSSLSIGTPSFHRYSADTLFAIKGSTLANYAGVIAYYTASNTSMTQSTPTNKLDNYGFMPRVLFITG